MAAPTHDLDGDEHTDKRADERRRCLLGARAVTSDYSTILDCSVRNRSASGAGLRLAAPQNVPADFTLIFVSEGAALDAKVVWRSGLDFGVSLGERHDLNPPPVDPVRRLRHVWLAAAVR